MAPLTFTVIEITLYEGYANIRVQIGSSDSQQVTCGDVFGFMCSPEIAALNSVDSPLVLSAP